MSTGVAAPPDRAHPRGALEGKPVVRTLLLECGPRGGGAADPDNWRVTAGLGPHDRARLLFPFSRKMKCLLRDTPSGTGDGGDPETNFR